MNDEAKAQGLRYLVVGGFNTAFGFSSFAALHLLFEDDLHYLVILVAAWVINVFEGYVAYRYLVFKVRGHFWRDLGRFSLVYVGAFCFNLVALPVGVDLIGLPVLVTQGIVLVVTIAASFVAHRRFSFRR